MRPVVEFDCEKARQDGLRVADGNLLRLFHATITALTQDAAHAPLCEIRAGDVQISESALSWIDGDMTYGFGSAVNPLRGVTFEHGGRALGNGQQWAVDCTFRDLQVGVQDGGCLEARLVRCRFQDNRRNWELGYTLSGIVAVDCTFGLEQDPGPHVRRWRPGDGPWHHPSFVALRHLVIHVQDEGAKPIEGALVEVTESSGDLSAVHHRSVQTDRAGRTPAPEARGALLVTDYAYRATDDAPEPNSHDCRIESHDYRYSVRVTADGYQPTTVAGVDPDQSWTERTVALRRR